MVPPLKVFFILVVTFQLVGCDRIFESAYCDLGYKSAQNKNYKIAKSLLNRCLNSKSLSTERRAIHLQARAWTHYSLEDYEQALKDQEASYDLKPPTTHREFINHASYLRKLGKYQESLEPLLRAQIMDEQHGHISMMTQYNLGWSFYELEMHVEAIDAFTKGIPSQPDYPFVYFRRGLAYDRIGDLEKAKSDFGKFVEFYGSAKMDFPVSFLKELDSVAHKYEILRNFAAGAT